MSASYDTSAEGTIGYASAFGGYQGFQYRLSGTWTDYDDRRTPDGTMENTSYEIQDYSAFLGYDRNKFSFGATYENYQGDFDSHTPEGTIGDTLTYFQLDLPEWSREKFGGFVEVRDIANFLPRMRLDAYYQNTVKLFKNDMDLNIPMGIWGDMLIENRIATNNDQDTIGGNFQIDWQPHPDHYVILGFEVINDCLDASSETSTFTDSPMPPPFGSQTTTVTKYNYDAEMNTQALYIQDEWTLPADFTRHFGRQADLGVLGTQGHQRSQPGKNRTPTTPIRCSAPG